MLHQRTSQSKNRKSFRTITSQTLSFNVELTLIRESGLNQKQEDFLNIVSRKMCQHIPRQSQGSSIRF